MFHFDVHFVHKPLEQVKIYGVSVSLYPVLDSTISAAERADGFHVIKNNLLAANLTPRQLLNAMGQQTGQSAVVDGSIAGYLWHFHDHWRNFRNLTVLSWHNSAGTINHYGGGPCSLIASPERSVGQLPPAGHHVRQGSSIC